MAQIQSLDQIIVLAQRKVVSRFLMLGVAFTLITTIGLVSLIGFNASDVARALTNSYRNQLLLGLVREPVQGFGANIPTTFSSVKFYDRTGSLVFSLPDQSDIRAQAIAEIVFDHELRLNEKDARPSGVVRYGISLVGPILWCFGAFFIAVAIGFPLLRRSLRQSREQTISMIQMQQRDEFSALARQIAHDIRSPLSAISIAAHAVRGSNSKASLMMVAASERIQKMATQLLDYSRSPSLRNSVTENTKDSFVQGKDLLKVIEDVRAESMSRFDCAIELDVPLRLNASYRLNPDQFARILSNLLNNAFEALQLVSREGKMSISLKQNVDHIEIAITDNGPGIPQDHIELILAGQSFGKSQGNGLGVSSARRFVESWGGHFKIDSSVGEGTSVRITILEAPRSNRKV